MTALKAMTIWSAYQHFEEKTKGSIEVGKLADLVILSQDPTRVDPENIDQIRVLETIKEGKTIYRRTTTAAADERARTLGDVIGRTVQRIAVSAEARGFVADPLMEAARTSNPALHQKCACSTIALLTEAMATGKRKQ